MTHEASIRPYVAADLEACLVVFDSNVPEYFRASERQEFIDFLDALPGPYFVVERGADVVGCGGYAVREERAVADLCWGMVHSDRHGEGLGGALTKHRLDLALTDPRVREVELSTSQLTTRFYERLGFRVHSVEPDGYGPGLDKCAMRLASTPSTG